MALISIDELSCLGESKSSNHPNASSLLLPESLRLFCCWPLLRRADDDLLMSAAARPSSVMVFLLIREDDTVGGVEGGVDEPEDSDRELSEPVSALRIS